MAIEAVLFDLDHTLWRPTAPPDWNAITALQVAELMPHCARLGLDHLDLGELVRRFWSAFDAAYPSPDGRPDAPLEEPRWRSGPSAIRSALAEYDRACADDDAACLWEALHNVPLRVFNVHLFPDATSTVAALSAAGYRLAVVTARPLSAAIVARELRDQGLPDVFETIVTSGELGYRKQHPSVFKAALSQLAMRPERALMIGDSYEDDVVPATSAGIIPVLKLNERAPDPRFVLARYQIPSLAALLQLEIFR